MDDGTNLYAVTKLRIYLLGSLFVLVSWQSRGQVCDCPPAGTCAPCQGILTSLTLQYNGGLLGLLVRVTDGGGQIFLGTLSNGETFTLTSSQAGQPFVGSSITITETLLVNTVINITCATPIFVGSNFGNFTVIAGRSLIGGALCCQTTETTPPVIAGCPSDITVPASPSICGANVNWTAPTASDNCAVASFISSHNPGDFFPVGSLTTVTYTVTDNYGNMSTCSFSVTVNDVTTPIFQNCPSPISIAANNSCEVVVNWAAPSASDNCGVASLTSSHQPGERFATGVTVVEYKAIDIYGNASFCRFDVIIRSEEEPVISGCPEDILVTVGETGEVTITWEPPTAATGCGDLLLTGSHEPGALFSVGTTTVEYTDANDSGHTASCTFNVIVSYEDLFIDVAKAITPDGDGINDEWIITNIEKFSRNKVIIVDRWGSVIYRASGYNNSDVVWRGLNSSGTLVPTGTYFYVIEVDFIETRLEKRGFIELIR